MTRHQEAHNKANEEKEVEGYHHIICQQISPMKQNLYAFLCVFYLLKLFAKHVFPLVTLVANNLKTFMHFRLRLCFLVVVPFNLNCKLQLSALKGI